jgi:hypothetical protein
VSIRWRALAVADQVPAKGCVAASVMHFAKERVYDATELSRAVLKDFKLLE